MKRRREESPEEEATPETLAKIGEFLAENEVEAFEIALQMPLSSVLSLCRVNSFFSQICESEYFWRRRVLKDFGEKSQLFGRSWKQTYQILTYNINPPPNFVGLLRVYKNGNIDYVQQPIIDFNFFDEHDYYTLDCPFSVELVEIAQMMIFISSDDSSQIYSAPLEQVKLTEDHGSYKFQFQNGLEGAILFTFIYNEYNAYTEIWLFDRGKNVKNISQRVQMFNVNVDVPDNRKLSVEK